MKKNLLFAAIALTALAGCTTNDYVGDQSLLQGGANGEGAISFNLETPAITRATNGGKTAATALSNRFIVWGEKNESSGDAATAANLVFKNYKVEWTDNSAYTSTSNTQNWEYVGLTPYTAAQVSPSINPTTQTIKYWDYAATSYTFTAVSALDEDITSGKVIITKTESGSTVYDKGYEIAIKTDASTDNIFVADRNNPTLGSGTDRNASNTRGGNVKMSFRNFMSKIRFGIYENIPGYKVKITKVTYNNGASNSTTDFAIDGKFIVPGDNTIFNVTYENAESANPNKVKATLKYEPNHATTPASNNTYFVSATSPILSAANIGETATAATFDKTSDAYTTILPYSTNATNLKLTIDFQLISDDTHETINISGKTAEVPAKYCQWLSNYAYSYIFKITDDGLYPITFDAVEITDETGKAEYITTVTEPSITTYAKASAVTTNGDYKDGEKIYATVMDGSSLATLDGTNMFLYKVTSSDASFLITEASVAEALIEGPTWTKAQADLKKIACVADGTGFNYGKTVVAPDGTTLTMDESNNVVADFTGAKTQIDETPTYGPTYYAIVYEKTAATYTVDTGNTYADETAFNNAGTLYTTSACTVVATWGDSSTLYYKRTAVSNKGVYAVKIVKVVP